RHPDRRSELQRWDWVRAPNRRHWRCRLPARRSSSALAARSGGLKDSDRPSHLSRRATKCIHLPHLTIALQVFEAPAQNDAELVDEGGLERGEPILLQPDQRCVDRLMSAS